MWPISLRGLSFFCVAIIMASMKLSSEIFAVRHSPYPVSKFKLGRPSARAQRKWLGTFFCDEQEMKYEKDENSRPLNLVRVSCAL